MEKKIFDFSVIQHSFRLLPEFVTVRDVGAYLNPQDAEVADEIPGWLPVFIHPHKTVTGSVVYRISWQDTGRENLLARVPVINYNCATRPW